MRPLLKWAGGKTKLLPELIQRLPSNATVRGEAFPTKICHYAEPFVGGGALFFHLASLGRIQRATMVDKNAALINFYEEVRDHPRELVEEVRRCCGRPGEAASLVQAPYDKENYYAMRDAFNEHSLSKMKQLTKTERAAVFLYLNKTCFNGLWRVNKAGQFNVPWGKYENPTIVDADQIYRASTLLQGVELFDGDFTACNAPLHEPTLVYCDPPYDTLSPTSNFTSYAAGGFSWDEQIRLESWARSLNAHVIVSNAATERIRELYASKHWERHEVLAARAINCKGAGRGKVGEYIFVKR